MDNQENETTTQEINSGEDTKAILQAVGELRREISGRFDKIEREQAELKQEFTDFKNYVETQFEAVRQGLVQSHTEFNQLISEISQNRSAIFSTKAAVNELQEKMYLLTKNINQTV